MTMTTTKSIYRSNQHATSKLRTVRSREHLERWADDCGIRFAGRGAAEILDEILEYERKHGDLGTSPQAEEVQGWAAKDVVRAIEPERRGQWSPWGAL
jgi:hypothetical protein